MMFIKELKIKNFKCFGDKFEPLVFNVPDGNTIGSGLNIFVGENNMGKSTVFEAIDFLRNSTKKDISVIKNKNSQNNDLLSVDLIFSGSISDVIENFSQANKKTVFNKYIYTNGSHNYFRLSRTSENLKTIQLWNNNESEFKNESGIDAPLKKLFEINFVWSDTNPNDEASFGSTTICGHLLKEIAHKFQESEDYIEFSKQFQKTFNDEQSGLRKELKIIEERTQEIFIEQFGDAKIAFHFNELNIDSFLKNTIIEIDDGVPTSMKEKGSGMQRSLALALLQVYAEELIKHPENQQISKPFFLFIDEPEICLHPQAQIKLFNALLELSKTKQIFLATHSPYFFNSTFLKNIGIFIFSKNGSEIKVTKLNSRFGLFPWSPSWGEINYFSYNLPTVEFHNELYGFIQAKAIIEDDKNYYEDSFDLFLQGKGLALYKKPWTKLKKDGTKEECNRTTQTYIRNSIHHPENEHNEKYSDGELKTSIEEMINLLRGL